MIVATNTIILMAWLLERHEGTRRVFAQGSTVLMIDVAYGCRRVWQLRRAPPQHAGSLGARDGPVPECCARVCGDFRGEYSESRIAWRDGESHVPVIGFEPLTKIRCALTPSLEFGVPAGLLLLLISVLVCLSEERHPRNSSNRERDRGIAREANLAEK